AFQRLGNAKDAKTAEQLWKQMEEMVGEKGLTFNKQTYSLAQLRAEFERASFTSARVVAGYPVFRGDPSRTAQSNGSEPFLEPMWNVSMTRPSWAPNEDSRSQGWFTQAKEIEDKLNAAVVALERGAQKRPVLPGFYPIAARNRIIFRTYDGVYAY